MSSFGVKALDLELQENRLHKATQHLPDFANLAFSLLLFNAHNFLDFASFLATEVEKLVEFNCKSDPSGLVVAEYKFALLIQ